MGLNVATAMLLVVCAGAAEPPVPPARPVRQGRAARSQGFVAAPGTVAERRSKEPTGWAEQIVHEKTGIVLEFIPAAHHDGHA